MSPSVNNFFFFFKEYYLFYKEEMGRVKEEGSVVGPGWPPCASLLVCECVSPGLLHRDTRSAV